MEYLHRGWQPIPIPAGSKGPAVLNWQHLRVIPETVASDFLGAGNIGLLLGQPSGELVDVDLDCPEARELADRFLPPTNCFTGRPSSRRSHRWYVSPGVETTRHRDPVSKATIVELRGTGSQTLVGPSIHPSGERYEALAGEPAIVHRRFLVTAVQQLALEVIRLRHGENNKHLAPKPRLLRGQTYGHPDFQARIPIAPTSDKLIRRASAYLGAMPAAISGQGGHRATYAAAVVLVHGFGLTVTEALALLSKEYNPRCQPPWTDQELLHKVTDALNRPHRRPYGWLITERRRESDRHLGF